MADNITIVKDLFPKFSDEKIQDALDSAQGDVNTACTMLLSEQEAINSMNCSTETPEKMDSLESPGMRFTKSSPVNLRTRLKKPALSFGSPKSSRLNLQEIDSKEKVWAASSNEINKIIQLTNVSEKMARNAYYLNSFNSAKAVIDLIIEFDKYVTRYGFDDLNWHQTTTPQNLTNLGGKVQSGQGPAHLKTRQSKSETNEKSVRFKLSKPSSQKHTSNYKYDEWSSEAQELKNLVSSNDSLRSISPDFLKASLEFFEGDVIKTIIVAQHIIQSGSTKSTFLNLSSSRKSEEQDITNNIGLSLPQKKVATKNDGGLAKPMFLSDQNYTKTANTPRSIHTRPSIDLHGYFPDEAVITAEACLDEWWNEELHERELNKQNLKQIKAMNVPAFKITTGRGLHSVGGYSKVRQRIKMFLDANSYVYIEEPSFFVIEGRRRFHRI